MKNSLLKIRCSFSDQVPPGRLKPHPKNPRRHSAAQIALLGKILAHQGWRAPIVVSKRSGFIVAGHARFEAARKLGIKKVPVDYQDFASNQDELAHLLADNRLAELGETDPSDLSALLGSLQGGMDLELAGFAATDLDFSTLLPDPPASIEEAKDALDKIKAQRRKGNKDIIAKTDTEYYLVLMFPSRTAKQKMLSALSLPDDERYITADSVVILPGKLRNSSMPKSAPANKAGSCG